LASKVSDLVSPVRELSLLDNKTLFIPDFRIADRPSVRVGHASSDKEHIGNISNDSKPHIDVPSLSPTGVVYGFHLTTEGSGRVTAACSNRIDPELAAITERDFTRSVDQTHCRNFGIGDLHIFVRQGSIDTLNEQEISPSTHGFISTSDARSYIEGSFGFTEVWPEA